MGKARPKFIRATGRTYTPKTTMEYEEKIRAAYLEKYGKDECPEGAAYSVVIRAYFPIPKSDRKATRIKKEQNIIRPIIKPDLDNVGKVVLDGLNGVAFKDDKQVVSLKVYKFYADEPYIHIVIQDVELIEMK